MSDELKALLGDLTIQDAIALHEASEEQEVDEENSKERESERRQSAFVLRVLRLLASQEASKSTSDSWEERYGADIAEWLQDTFHMFSQEYDYMDNGRVYEVGSNNEDHYKQFRKQEAEGCCGSFEKFIRHRASGRTFVIGFNYGH